MLGQRNSIKITVVNSSQDNHVISCKCLRTEEQDQTTSMTLKRSLTTFTCHKCGYVMVIHRLAHISYLFTLPHFTGVKLVAFNTENFEIPSSFSNMKNHFYKRKLLLCL